MDIDSTTFVLQAYINQIQCFIQVEGMFFHSLLHAKISSYSLIVLQKLSLIVLQNRFLSMWCLPFKDWTCLIHLGKMLYLIIFNVRSTENVLYMYWY